MTKIQSLLELQNFISLYEKNVDYDLSLRILLRTIGSLQDLISTDRLKVDIFRYLTKIYYRRLFENFDYEIPNSNSSLYRNEFHLAYMSVSKRNRQKLDILTKPLSRLTTPRAKGVSSLSQKIASDCLRLLPHISDRTFWKIIESDCDTILNSGGHSDIENVFENKPIVPFPTYSEYRLSIAGYKTKRSRIDVLSFQFEKDWFLNLLDDQSHFLKYERDRQKELIRWIVYQEDVFWLQPKASIDSQIRNYIDDTTTTLQTKSDSGLEESFNLDEGAEPDLNQGLDPLKDESIVEFDYHFRGNRLGPISITVRDNVLVEDVKSYSSIEGSEDWPLIQSAFQAASEIIDSIFENHALDNHRSLRGTLIEIKRLMDTDKTNFNAIKFGINTERLANACINSVDTFDSMLIADLTYLGFQFRGILQNLEDWKNYVRFVKESDQIDLIEYTESKKVLELAIKDEALDPSLQQEILKTFDFELQGIVEEVPSKTEALAVTQTAQNILETCAKFLVEKMKETASNLWQGSQQGIKIFSEAAVVAFLTTLCNLLFSNSNLPTAFAWLIPFYSILKRYVEKEKS